MQAESVVKSKYTKSAVLKDSLILGIDGGGSKCRAVLMSNDNVILGTGTSGPGNPVYGLEQAKNSIEHSALMALENSGLSAAELGNVVVGIGLAGVNVPQHYKNIMEWQHPFKQIFLATDLLAASLGAHNGKDGAVIVSGTGTCGFSYVNQKSVIIGGHGFPQGDKGSGAWFGLKAIEQVLLTLDGIGAPTQLVNLVLNQLKAFNSQDIVEIVAGKPAAFFAQLAGAVFVAAEANDSIALAILRDGAKYISDMARKLLDTHPPRLSLIGGLGASLLPWLDTEIKDTLSAPLHPPEIGAVIYARQQMQSFALVR